MKEAVNQIAETAGKVKQKTTARPIPEGTRFGRLVVTGVAQVFTTPSGQKHSMSNCQCICGQKAVVLNRCLRGGNTKSCGCFRIETCSTKATTHGMNKSKTYSSWSALKKRCNTSSTTGFHNWGGRGIRVCERWNKFENFLADMGERPDGTSIDRIDNDGDYCLENCRWADKKTQSRNKSTNRVISIQGAEKCTQEWSDISGVSACTIRRRLILGWSAHDAVFRSVRKKIQSKATG